MLGTIQEKIDAIIFLKRHSYLNLNSSIYANIDNLKLSSEQIKKLEKDFKFLIAGYIRDDLEMIRMGDEDLLKSKESGNYWILAYNYQNKQVKELNLFELTLNKVILTLEDAKYLISNLNETESDVGDNVETEILGYIDLENSRLISKYNYL